jgi:single-stranded-DNA-specific exonuclease
VAGRPRTVGSDGSHLKFEVRPRESTDDRPPTFDAIGFGMGEKLSVLEESQEEDKPFELLFSLEENTWNGETNLQFKARDLRLEEE